MYYIYLFNILIKVALPWEKILRPSLLVSRIHCLLKRLSLYPKLKKFLLKCEEKIKSYISLFIVFIYLFIFPFLYLSLHTHSTSVSVITLYHFEQNLSPSPHTYSFTPSLFLLSHGLM